MSQGTLPRRGRRNGVNGEARGSRRLAASGETGLRPAIAGQLRRARELRARATLVLVSLPCSRASRGSPDPQFFISLTLDPARRCRKERCRAEDAETE